MKYHADFVEKLRANGVEVVDAGMVDSNEKGFEACDVLNGAGVDLIMCNMVTYATSSVFAPVLRGCNAPMILVALQPKAALDYDRACTFMQLENDNICSVPEFMGVAVRFNKKIHDVVIGTLYDDCEADAEIKKWCDIASVLASLKGARMGLMGHVLEAMYDMHADPTAIASAFGVHVPLLEIDDVLDEYEKVTEAEIQEKIALSLRLPVRFQI
jgi:L-arabinose isomerase